VRDERVGQRATCGGYMFLLHGGPRREIQPTIAPNGYDLISALPGRERYPIYNLSRSTSFPP
jgi:hypothetical protein